MNKDMGWGTFEDLFTIPLKNGLTKPTHVRGEGYKMVNMGELFTFSRIGNVPMARVPLTETEKKSSLLEIGDILFARQSLVIEGAGKCSIITQIEEPTTFEGHIIRVRLNRTKCNPFFYYYFFNSPLGRQIIESIIEQVAAAGIRGSDLAKLKVPNPPLEIQDEVALILSSLDDKIDLNNQINHTLEEITRTIYKAWFVNFDPVHDKVKGRETNLPTEIATLFPDSFQDSPIGNIPKGWNLVDIATFVNQIKNSISPNKYPESRFNHYSIPAYDENHYPSFEYGSQILSNKFLLEGKKILISKLNPENPRIWFVNPNSENPSICSTEFLVLEPKKSYHPEYIYSLVSSTSFQDRFISLVTGSTGSHQRVQPDSFMEIQVIEPPPDLVRFFSSVTKPMIDKQLSNLAESNDLKNLRDTLLPKLMAASS